DGFSWCSLRGGANSGTYQKPLIDNLRYPKLAYYTNRMVFQRTWAGSNNVDVVYGPEDLIEPVIHHIGRKKEIVLIVSLLDIDGTVISKKKFFDIYLSGGRNVVKLPSFHFEDTEEGVFIIKYE